MKRVLLIMLLCVAGACSKPTADDCRKAVLNLQRIRGLDTSSHAPDPEAFTRKCRATGDPKVVKCIIDAKTEGEVARCEPGAPPPQ